MTDVAITDVLGQDDRAVEIVWKPEIFLPFHPNGMSFAWINDKGEKQDEWTVYSASAAAVATGSTLRNAKGPVSTTFFLKSGRL